MAGVAVGVSSAAVQAAPGTLAVTNACLSNATVTYSDLTWTLKGAVTPNTVTRGDTVTLTNSSVVVDIPATLLIAGYNLGLLVVGNNAIPTTIFVAREATNVDTGGGAKGTVTKVDQFTITANTFITDTPGPTPTDPHVVTATPLNINQPLPDFTVTTLGGNVEFRQGGTGSIGNIPVASVQQAAPGVQAYPAAPLPVAGGLWASASVAGGLIRANFDCSAGTTNISPVPGTSGPTFTPAAAIAPFETVNVVAPPTAPVCTSEAPSVGVTQSITINLNDNCTDDNEAQGGGSPFTFAVSAPSAGTLTQTAPGVYSYTAPATDPGAPVVLTFTATDSGIPPLTSTPTNISIKVLGNQCDATAAPCDLTQIVIQNVVGTVMTMDKVPGVVSMSDVTLNGAPQVSTGALNTLTVTNARGTAAAWSVTAYATDLGASGTPTFTVPVAPGAVIPVCSNAGAGPFTAVATAESGPIGSNRLCIPGDNLGWSPAAVVGHSTIPGDVAEVVAGAPSAADAATWLAALVAAGNTKDPGVGVNGLGGLGSTNTLCSAPVNHSGGTFTCNASLYLGVPASAAAGTYQGGIVLTLA
jgi:hypothetical protein